MSRVHRSALFGMAALLVLILFDPGVARFQGSAGDNGVDIAPAFAKLERDMTPEQVRQLVGAPQRVARQILYHRYREQWIYDAPVPVRLTFECPRGQQPQLLSRPRLPVEKNDRDRGAKQR